MTNGCPIGMQKIVLEKGNDICKSKYLGELIMELPLKVSEEFSCYVCDGFFGNVLSSYNETRPWVYEFYLSLELKLGENKSILSEIGEREYRKSELHYCGFWTGPQTLFDYDSFQKEYFKNNDILKLLKECIDEQSYCFTYLDESKIFKSSNYCHDAIVTGYDDTKQQLTLFGFYGVKFVKKVIPYSVFIDSFYSGIENAYKYGMDLPKYFRAFRLRMPKSGCYQIDKQRMAEYCQDYLNSTIGNPSLYEGPEVKTEHNLDKCIVGNNTIQVIKKIMYYCFERTLPIDVRTVVMLRGYAILMEKRIRFLSNIINYNVQEMLQRSHKCVEDTKVLCNFVIKYNVMCKKDNNAEAFIISYVDSIAKDFKYFNEKLLIMLKK